MSGRVEEELARIRIGGGRTAFQAHCAFRHSLLPQIEVGRHLAGLIGRDMGSVQGFGYSEAPAGAAGKRNRDLLAEVLTVPSRRFEGTAMPPVGLDEATIAEIAAFPELRQAAASAQESGAACADGADLRPIAHPGCALSARMVAALQSRWMHRWRRDRRTVGQAKTRPPYPPRPGTPA
ncbi:cytochrome c family protein [Poseidonocella sp. HB161398]|uniref:c-type cytochrome n=1 Tax=Poseidonocella sp. HB161398 TaxID=2320855 RepID=UPI001108C175|nr:hypothetical protein [Poseidonocella sp. HB161398]